MTLEADIAKVLDVCRVMPNIPTSELLMWACDLDQLRLWRAGKAISDTQLIKPPGPGGTMVWPSNDAVLACHRAGAQK